MDLFIGIHHTTTKKYHLLDIRYVKVESVHLYMLSITIRTHSFTLNAFHLFKKLQLNLNISITFNINEGSNSPLWVCISFARRRILADEVIVG